VSLVMFILILFVISKVKELLFIDWRNEFLDWVITTQWLSNPNSWRWHWIVDFYFNKLVIVSQSRTKQFKH
jgi:hypothetical protein